MLAKEAEEARGTKIESRMSRGENPGDSNKGLRAASERLREIQEQLKGKEALTTSIVETTRQPFIVVDEDFAVVTAKHAFYTTFNVTKEETEGTLLYEFSNGHWNIPKVCQLFEVGFPKSQPTVISGKSHGT